MQPIKEVYPNAQSEDGYWSGVYAYQPMLESLGHEILLQVDDHDYQGDSRLILRNAEGQYGLLIFGWGSCSGCDALQACDSYEELDELRTRLSDSIQWSTKEELYSYVTTKDWELEWAWHAEETKDFVTKATELLRQ